MRLRSTNEPKKEACGDEGKGQVSLVTEALKASEKKRQTVRIRSRVVSASVNVWMLIRSTLAVGTLIQVGKKQPISKN